MTENICPLCEKNNVEVQHHPIPRNVIKAVNPKSELNEFTIGLCKKCELETHYAFLKYLIDSQMHDGYNRLNAVKYFFLKKWVKKHNLKMYKGWMNYWKRFLDDSLKEFKAELREEN